MRRAEMALAIACVALFGACRKGAAPEPSPSEPPPAAEAAPQAPAEEAPAAEAPPPAAAGAPVVPPPTAQPGQTMGVIAVRLGPPPEEGPGTFEGGVFRPGAEVTASVDVSPLPQGAIVKVNWFDANGTALGEEHKPVTGGVHWLTFTGPGSSSWANGTYRVEFVVSTGGYANETFLIGEIADRPTAQPG